MAKVDNASTPDDLPSEETRTTGLLCLFVVLECHEHFVYPVAQVYMVVNNGNAGHLVCFGVWYLSFFLTDRLCVDDMPIFLSRILALLMVFLADQFMEQVDGLILVFKIQHELQVVNSSNGGTFLRDRNWRHERKFEWNRCCCCLWLSYVLIFSSDLGSTLVFPPIAFTLLYVARIPKKFFLSTFLLFVVLLCVLSWDVFRYYQHKSENPHSSNAITAYEETSLVPLKDYQRKRILTFIAPEIEDPHGIGANWNRIQALIAVATGGLTGKGLGEGMQAKLGYLPSAVAHNDFIFAVLAEESGLVGGSLALIVYAFVIFGCLKVASKASDRFGSMIAVGVSVLLMTHLFVNIGMTIGITPITGLPLPFLSYGGSFLVTCFLMLGVVQSVFRHRKVFRS